MDPFEFVGKVFALCFKYDGSVSSWGRTVKHNQFVGGVGDSCHMLWIGCDVVLDGSHVFVEIADPSGGRPNRVGKIIQASNPEFERDAAILGLTAILERDHYHVQPAGLKR
jgi:hypothetical protein